MVILWPLTFGAVARAQNGPPIVLTDTPNGGPVDKHEFTIPPGAASVTRTLFLRRNAGNLGNVTLLVDPDPDVNVTLTGAGGGNPAPTLAVDLAQGETVVLVTASVTTASGEATIVARTATGIVPVTSLAVTRAGTLTVAGAAADGVKLTSHSTPFKATLDVFTGNAPVKGLRAEVEAFRNDAGESVTPDRPEVAVSGAVGPTTVDVPADRRATVSVSASLPLAGTWRSVLRLFHDGVADPPIPLVVTRSVAPSSLEVLTTPLARIDTGDVVSRLVVIRETTGRQVTVSSPKLLLVDRADGETALEGKGQITEVVDVTDSKEQKIDGTFSIAGSATKRLRVTVDLPDKTGEYTYRIRFEEEDAQHVDAAFTTTVRRPAWVAAAWIAGALAVSLIGRYWWAGRETRRTARIQVAAVREALVRRRAALEPLGPDERSVLDGLAAAVEVADVQARKGEAADAGKMAEVLTVRLQAGTVWVQLSKRVAAAPGSLPKNFRPRLDALAARITADPELDVTVANSLLVDVNGLVTAYEAELKAWLERQIAGLRQDVTAVLGADEVDSTLSATLTRATDAAGSGRTEEALTALVEAEAEAARRLAGRIRDELDRAVDPELGLSEDEWREASARVMAALDKIAQAPDTEALERYREVDAMLLNIVGGALRQRILGRITELENVQNPSTGVSSELTAQRALRTKVGKALDQARINPFEARTALQEAITEFRDLPPQDGQVLGATVLNQAFPGLLGASLTGTGQPHVPTASATVPDTAPPTREELLQQRQHAELWASVVALLVAVPLGLAFLYNTNYTWGNLADIVAAITWGLGAQQLSGQAFTGVADLRQQLFPLQ